LAKAYSTFIAKRHKVLMQTTERTVETSYWLTKGYCHALTPNGISRFAHFAWSYENIECCTTHMSTKSYVLIVYSAFIYIKHLHKVVLSLKAILQHP